MEWVVIREDALSVLCTPSILCALALLSYLQTGRLINERQVHENAIQDMQVSPDGAYVITASLDCTSKLVDIVNLEPLKTYKSGHFVQSAAISPLFDHVRGIMF